MPNVTIEYYIVAGGGAGGSNGGGGGGGGQAIFNSASIPVGYSGAVTVGAGGFTAGANGTASSIAGVISAAGGNAGFSDHYLGGTNGGGVAGGGGAGGGNDNYGGGGGGGGQTSTGGVASNSRGGNGGVGVTISNFFPITRTLAGGGGGGGAETSTGGDGWGGGGQGGRGDLAGGYIPPVAAVPNTGAGGGGGNGPSGALGWLGAVGGSGIVGIRYLLSAGVVASGGTIADAFGYRVHTFLSNGMFTVTSTNATVPNVVGQTQAAADSAIAGAGLVSSASSSTSTTVATGNVISQSPAAGTVVASGTTVFYVVSSGLPQVAVPNLVGLNQNTARNNLQNAGFVIGTVTTTSSLTVAANIVISQNPAAGTVLPFGSTVTFVYSTGLPQVTVPNVVGQQLAAATTAITNANLTLVTPTTSATSQTVPAQSIISQTPAAGAVVSYGSAVAVVVSIGPDTVTPAVSMRVSQEVVELLGQPRGSSLVAVVSQLIVETLIQKWADTVFVSQALLETIGQYEHYLITLAPPALASAWPGVPYSQALTATGSPHPGYVFSLSAGTLADGLALSSTGVISGTPTEMPVLATGPLPPATVDTPYAFQITVSNPGAAHPVTVRATDTTGMFGEQPYIVSTWALPVRFTLEGTKLPPCLSLSPDGMLAGSSMLVWDAPLTIRATDALGHTIVFTYQFRVEPKP